VDTEPGNRRFFSVSIVPPVTLNSLKVSKKQLTLLTPYLCLLKTVDINHALKYAR
jgi:hypothetical protein